MDSIHTNRAIVLKGSCIRNMISPEQSCLELGDPKLQKHKRSSVTDMADGSDLFVRLREYDHVRRTDGQTLEQPAEKTTAKKTPAYQRRIQVGLQGLLHISYLPFIKDFSFIILVSRVIVGYVKIFSFVAF